MSVVNHDCKVPLDLDIPDDVSVYLTVWKCQVCNARWKVRYRKGSSEATCIRPSSERWKKQKLAEIREQNADHATGIRGVLARLARLDDKGNLRE